MWLWLALSSGILLGFYDIFRKKALMDVPLFNVLASYSLISLVLVSFEFQNAMAVNKTILLLIALKSVIIFGSWIMGFLALRSLPISVATPLDTMTPLFTIILGLIMLNEKLGFLQVIGVLIVLGAYYLIGKAGHNEIGDLFKNKYFYLAAGAAFLSATSALIDKSVLKIINTGQLQFWFCLFVAILYFAAFFFYRIKNNDPRRLKFNYAILLMSIFLVVSDRIYFNAMHIAASKISIALPLRRISILESSIGGGILFKEKNLRAKFCSVCLVIIGIAIIFIGK